MTRKYKKQFSNGLIANLKINATTGRGFKIEGRRQVSTRVHPPTSELALRWQGQECTLEEEPIIQAEFNKWLAECATDMSRAIGGILSFQPPKVPVYEVRKYTPPE